MIDAAGYISEAWWRVRETARLAWLFVKHRPLIACPFCKGKGGEMSGYEEPEWAECSVCWSHWEELDDYGWRWPVGRLPVLWYARARLSMWFGLWYAARFRDLLRCKLGIHRWMNEDDTEPGLRLCCVCYAHKKDGGKVVTDED